MSDGNTVKQSHVVEIVRRLVGVEEPKHNYKGEDLYKILSEKDYNDLKEEYFFAVMKTFNMWYDIDEEERGLTRETSKNGAVEYDMFDTLHLREWKVSDDSDDVRNIGMYNSVGYDQSSNVRIILTDQNNGLEKSFSEGYGIFVGDKLKEKKRYFIIPGLIRKLEIDRFVEYYDNKENPDGDGILVNIVEDANEVIFRRLVTEVDRKFAELNVKHLHDKAFKRWLNKNKTIDE